jgi:hypothetical protein
VEANDPEPFTNIPTVCPKCGKTLWKVNALQTSYPVILVGCRDSKCRWSEEYEL